MRATEYKVDSYRVEIYASDLKGARTRWGEKLVRLFSEGKEVAQAVFAREGEKVPESYISEGKIYYFAPDDRYADVIDLLRNEKPVYVVWQPVSDPKEPNDGDAIIRTG